MIIIKLNIVLTTLAGYFRGTLQLYKKNGHLYLMGAHGFPNISILHCSLQFIPSLSSVSHQGVNIGDCRSASVTLTMCWDPEYKPLDSSFNVPVAMFCKPKSALF